MTTQIKKLTETINVSIDIDVERIKDLLCCALEGGVNYWCQISKGNVNANIEHWHLDWIYQMDGSLIITDLETNKKYEINRSSLSKGLKLMAEKYDWHFEDFINENEDATTGNVFLQCVVLKDLIYG